MFNKIKEIYKKVITLFAEITEIYEKPTVTPTLNPTAMPTAFPTLTPSIPTAFPTVTPTAYPTVVLTAYPTNPTVYPTFWIRHFRALSSFKGVILKTAKNSIHSPTKNKKLQNP